MKSILTTFKKWSKFKQILTSILATILFLGVILLITLGIYLRTYEHNHPQYLVDQILEQYIDEDFEDIIEKSPEAQQSELKDNLAKVIDQEHLFAYQAMAEDNIIEYTVVNNNAKLATIRLEKTGEIALFNVPKVVVKEIEHYPLYTYSIQYPQDCNVTIDGTEIQSLGSVMEESSNFAAIGAAEVATYQYSLNHFAPIETISATSFENDSLVYVDESGLNYEIYHAIPEAKQADIQEVIAGFTKEYAKYTTIRGAGSGTVMKFVKTNSSVAKNIQSYSNTWGEVIVSDHFQDIELTRPIRYSENIYSYDVHTTYQVVSDEGEAKDFPFDFTIYVIAKGDIYAIFDMERTQEDRKLTLVEKKTEAEVVDEEKETESEKEPENTDKEASVIEAAYKVNDQKAAATMYDGNIKTSATFGDNENLAIQSEQAFSYVYIKWAVKPNAYTLQYGDQKATHGEQGFLHELITLKEAQKELSLTGLAGNKISEISVYSSGSLPSDVQDWQAPYTQSDILLFPTHADDDTLYMGPLICEYVAKGKKVQLSFVINHNDTLDRPHELLDGMWEMGLRAYPIIGDFADHYSDNLEHAKSLYDNDAMMKYLVSSIRKTKPTIVVGHDENGEYGHGVHMLNTFLLKDAIHLASDESYDATSYESYGGHTPSKTYLHLYQKNSITLDVHKKMDELGGLSPFEKAKAGFSKHTSQHQWDLAVEDSGVGDVRLFGLYHSTVGYDFKTNDLFEGL